MFNTTNISSSKTLKINACSGGIYKTFHKSWIERFHLDSPRADNILNRSYGNVVLQVVICGDMEVLAEIMSNKDYEEAIKCGDE